MRDHRVLGWGLLVGGMLLAGCSGGDSESKREAEVKATAATKATVTAMTAPTMEPTAEPTEEPTPEPTPLPTSPPEDEQPSAEELQLIGVVRAGSTPSAMIGFDGKQEIFRKGDSVFDHGTLKEVREDSVVIRSGDEDVILKLAATAPPPPTEPPVDSLVESRPPPVQEQLPPSTNQPLSKAEVRAALRDLKTILETAEAERVTVGGGHGLQLGKVEPGSFLAKLGLRNGDVLQKLDGFPVDDPERPPNLSSAADGNELTVGFTRDGIGLTVTRRLQ